MTNSDLIDLFEANIGEAPPAVTVIASDYRYDGWVIMLGNKRSGKLRCVVEDANGRCFIHNALQLRKRDENG